MRGDDGGFVILSIEGTPPGTTKHTQAAKAGARIDIPSIGRVPSFRVTLRPPATDEPDTRTMPAEAPLFVVADTHGEYEILVELLQKHRVIDGSLRWSFRRGHLVFLGDVFDRGPNQTEILWLIYQLEADARKSGGDVHLVLGNHEVMVMSGDLRYLNPRYIRTAEVLGVDSYSVLYGPRTLLGQWLRTKPAVLKLNDLLCLHGGISHEVVERKLTLHDINSTVRNALSNPPAQPHAHDELTTFILGKLGPLWYRGYFAGETDYPTTTSADVDDIRKYFGVSRILVGHTVVRTITPLHDGKVIAVQVYPHRDEKSGSAIMEAMRIDGGRLVRARMDGSTEEL